MHLNGKESIDWFLTVCGVVFVKLVDLNERGDVLRKINTMDTVDVSDELAEYSIKDFADLLYFLDKNGFTRLHFNGNEAEVKVCRIREIMIDD